MILVVFSVVLAGGGDSDQTPVAARQATPEPFVVVPPQDPSPRRGREPTRIVAYAGRPDERRLDLLITYSSGQRLREIRVKRSAAASLVVDVILTQHIAEDLRFGCVSVGWDVGKDTAVRQRARNRPPISEQQSARVARRLRHDCRSAPVLEANERVDVAPAPARYRP